MIAGGSSDFFIEWAANFVEEEGQKEIKAIMELLQVAEQVIASSVSDFEVKRKYSHVRNLVAKNIMQERNSTF